MISDDIKKILRGTDNEVTVTVKNKSGAAIDMSPAGTRIYAILSDGSKTIKAKFKNGGASSGWLIMDSTNVATGKIKLPLLSNLTSTLEPGKYYVEVRVRFASGAHPDDSFYDVGGNGYAFSIEHSQANTLTLPA